jgi:hypothetical protein
MAMLGAFYGAGKSNPEVMAEGWYIILEPYDYDVAFRAVLKYAQEDTREYASFPTVGNIVKCIREVMAEDESPVKDIVRAVSYGWQYDQLSDKAKLLIDEKQYKKWLNMDAEEFSNKAGTLARSLKKSQKLLKGVSE